MLPHLKADLLFYYFSNQLVLDPPNFHVNLIEKVSKLTPQGDQAAAAVPFTGVAGSYMNIIFSHSVPWYKYTRYSRFGTRTQTHLQFVLIFMFPSLFIHSFSFSHLTNRTFTLFHLLLLHISLFFTSFYSLVLLLFFSIPLRPPLYHLSFFSKNNLKVIIRVLKVKKSVQ